MLLLLALSLSVTTSVSSSLAIGPSFVFRSRSQSVPCLVQQEEPKPGTLVANRTRRIRQRRRKRIPWRPRTNKDTNNAGAVHASHATQTCAKNNTRAKPRKLKFSAVATIQQFSLSTVLATLLVSTLQAGVALLQYRKNPKGVLVIPPGPTVGIEEPKNKTPNAEENNQKDLLLPSSFSDVPSWSLRDNGNSDRTDISKQNRTNELPHALSSWVGRVNRFLFLLLPWLARQFHRTVLQQCHLWHVGIVLGLVRLVDACSRLWGATVALVRKHGQPNEDEDDSENLTTTRTTLRLEEMKTQEEPKQYESPTAVRRVLVLGDSLAVGLGSVEEFEATREPPEHGLEYWKIENPRPISPNNKSPVFPQTLARALARQQDCAVHWRSAGVDGGDASHIHSLLLPVLRDEVSQQVKPPLDAVILLCGMNDLKLQFARSVFRPWKIFSARTFRKDLETLLTAVLDMCPPTTHIVVPAMPVQMFLKKNTTVVSIFPLALILDVVVGYWECQKKQMVARVRRKHKKKKQTKRREGVGSGLEEASDARVHYLPLSAQVVEQWYRRDREELHRQYETTQQQEQQLRQRGHGVMTSLPPLQPGFVSADGIHPNAKCYSYWAEYVAEALVVANNARYTDNERETVSFF